MRNRQRGNASIEFALAAGILLPVMAGTFQFGYTFYTYNLLQAAVSNGGRCAAYRTYRCLAGATDLDKFRQAVQNMTVYGTPAPASSAVPVLRGLRPSDIEVTFTLSATQGPLPSPCASGSTWSTRCLEGILSGAIPPSRCLIWDVMRQKNPNPGTRRPQTRPGRLWKPP